MKGLRTTSQAASDSAPTSRASFDADLEQLRLQVEVMALKVNDALRRSTEVLLTGDRELADKVIAGDDSIDAMLVSLTGRCYDLLCRQTPVASDLRLIVSVLRIISDLERTGDLCLRIVMLAPHHDLLAANPETFEILRRMTLEAVDLFRVSIDAWATRNLRLATTLEERDDAMDEHYSDLVKAVVHLTGPAAVPIAIETVAAGRALERIADHSVMIGERLRYMLTGNEESLTREIGP